MKNSAEFRSIVQHGHAVKNEYFSIFFVQEDDFKIGFAAGRAPNKPMRNKLKRIARELWRTNSLQQHFSAHIVIITHKRALLAKHDKRQSEFNKLVNMIAKRCYKSQVSGISGII
ncbi:ribonuclease P protein component [candidate division KSB1 bacterium]|nr:ribonuclease P protein component [candidate division KSB1 bacterium]